MQFHRLILVASGAAATAVIGLGSTVAHGPGLIAGIEQGAQAARDKAGAKAIAMSFATPQGWLTRHPVLSGGDKLPEEVRARAAAAIAQAPGVGAVRWRSGSRRAQLAADYAGEANPLHCQKDVEAILEARSIRFSEASATIDPASQELLDEVAGALAPCVGSIIAVTGHTDNAGDEAANRALSRARADAVRWALIARGIPADGLRASGKGSSQPRAGLGPDDPANRRIDFSVIETMPLKPTPIDTPGPG